MATFTALTTLPGKDQAEALAAALETLDPEPTGVGIFEMEDGSGLWEVGGYFDTDPDQAGLALLASMHGARPLRSRSCRTPTGSPRSAASLSRSKRGASSSMAVMTPTR